MQQLKYREEEEPMRRPSRRKRKRRGVLSGIMILVFGIAIVVLAFWLLFHIQKITVTGNEYCSTDEVKAWISEGKYSSNSVYVWWKYNFTDVAQLPLVDESEVSLKNPWTIQVKVYEKSIVGYLDLEGIHVYFDKSGTVIQETADVVEGIPCIEGIEVEKSDIVVHEKLKVSNQAVFNNIAEVYQAAQKAEVKADQLVAEGKNITLYFGNIVVALGNGGYEEKMAQIPPILSKLNEQYPGQGGTLHLEQYSEEKSAISFTPEVAEEPVAEEVQEEVQEDLPEETQEESQQ